MVSRLTRKPLGPSCLVLVVKLTEFGRRLHRHADGATEEGVERIDPEDLALEKHAEVARDGFGDDI